MSQVVKHLTNKQKPWFQTPLSPNSKKKNDTWVHFNAHKDQILRAGSSCDVPSNILTNLFSSDIFYEHTPRHCEEINLTKKYQAKLLTKPN
jgi:hypothetical protein